MNQHETACIRFQNMSRFLIVLRDRLVLCALGQGLA